MLVTATLLKKWKKMHCVLAGKTVQKPNFLGRFYPFWVFEGYAGPNQHTETSENCRTGCSWCLITSRQNSRENIGRKRVMKIFIENSLIIP